MRRTWLVLLMMVILVAATLPRAAWGQSEGKRGQRPRRAKVDRTAQEFDARLGLEDRRAGGRSGKVRDLRKTAAAAAPLGLHQVGTFGDSSDTPAGTIDTPHDAAVDANGNILIVAPFSNTIHVIDSAGNPVRTYPGGEPAASTAQGRFDTPINIAVNRTTGDIYVTERFNHRVQRFDSNFGFLGMWGKNGGVNGESGNGNGEFNVPNGVAVNPLNNRVYVADSKNARVQVFEADGTFVGSFTHASFSQPSVRGVDVDDTGRAFAAAGSQVSVFDNAFNLLGSVGDNVSTDNLRGVAVSRDGSQVWAVLPGNGQTFRWTVAYNADGTVTAGSSNPDFNTNLSSNPRNIEVIPSTGEALIVDQNALGAAPLIKIDQNGNFLANIGSKIDPVGLFNFARDVVSAPASGARAGEVIFALDTGNFRVQRFSSSGGFLGAWGVPGNGGGNQFSAPLGIAADSAGDIYTVDLSTNLIQVFGQDGTFKRQWGGTQGTGDGQFNQARGIAIDSSDTVYVVDKNNHRVQVFDKNGTFLRKFGSQGSGAGQLQSPRHIEVDAAGNLYVAEQGNNRIQKFDNAGNSLMMIGVGELNNAFWVTVDANGNIYGGGFGQGTYKVFDPAGTLLGTVGSLRDISGIHAGADGRIYMIGQSSFAEGFVFRTNVDPVAVDDSFSTAFNTTLQVAAPGVMANDTDADGDGVTATLVDAPPSGAAFQLNSDGSFSYTPSGFVGTESFSYTISDGIARTATAQATSNVATVTITVLAQVNNAPVAVDDAYTVTTGESLSVAAPGVLSNDTDADGDALTAKLQAAPTNGTATISDNGALTYTPNTGFTGQDTLTYRVDDGQATALATVTITVQEVPNAAPVANDDSFTTTQGVALTVSAPGVLVNDTDADGDTLTSALVSGPANGTLSLGSDGSFTYTPNAGFSGTDSFQYQASDGTDSDTGTATITVDGNNAPTAVDDSYSASIGTQLTVAAPGVLENDTDPDGNALTASLATGPSNGALSLASDGSFTYTPNAGFSGTDSFTYTADDGLARLAASVVSSPATVTITVSAGAAPNAVNDSYSLTASKLVVAAPGVLDNDTDPESQPLTASLVSGPANGSLSLGGDGGFTYTPNAGFSGNDSFVYRASDGTLTADATATIAVQACAFAVSPTSASFNPSGGTTTVTVSTAAGCNWRARSRNAWLGLSTSRGSGSATITLTIDPNTGADRTTQAVIAGRTVIVQQEGAVCSYSLNNARAGFGSAGGGNTFTVDTAAECEWSATSSRSWINLGGGARTGAGTIAYTVDAHTGNRDRKGLVRISVEGKNLAVRIAQQGVESLEPLPPRSLVLRVRRKTNIKVFWGDAADNETGYLVKRRGRGVPNATRTFEANEERFLDKRLLPLTEYCYDVQAFNDEGFSPKATACARTQAARVATGLRVAHADHESVKLEWFEEAGVGQILERRVANSSDWLVVAEPEAGRSEIVDRGLSPNTLYEYRVRTCLTRACEAMSNSALALTLGGDGSQQPIGHEPRTAQHVTVPIPAIEIGANVADLPTLPVARIYKDADNGWSRIPADEDALSDLGYALGVNLFVHSLAELADGVPRDTHLVLLPRADEAALRAVADSAAQEALRSHLAGGGVLVVQQAGGAYRLPVDEAELSTAADRGDYRRLDALGGTVLVSDEPLERVREALLVALSNWRSETEPPRR